MPAAIDDGQFRPDLANQQTRCNGVTNHWPGQKRDTKCEAIPDFPGEDIEKLWLNGSVYDKGPESVNSQGRRQTQKSEGWTEYLSLVGW